MMNLAVRALYPIRFWMYFNILLLDAHAFRVAMSYNFAAPFPALLVFLALKFGLSDIDSVTAVSFDLCWCSISSSTPVPLMYQTSQYGCSVFSKLHCTDYPFWLWSLGPLSQRSIDFTCMSLFDIFSPLS